MNINQIKYIWARIKTSIHELEDPTSPKPLKLNEQIELEVLKFVSILWVS